MENVKYPRKDTYILIPAYKPDHLLIELLQKLKAEDFDVVVVNDGSGEEYKPVFEKVKEYAVLLEQNPNRGKGAALRFGFTYVNLNQNGHNYVITCDADGQHSVEDIIAINDKLHETNNIVLGSRTFDKSVPKRSRNGNFMSRLCRTLITKEYVQDDQCGLRGFPIKDIFNLISLQGNHYEYEMNVICNLQIKRLKFEEVPIQTIYLNDNKSSHFKPNLDTFRIQRTIWLNALAPLMCALISIGLLLVLALLIPVWPIYPSFGVAYIFYFELLIGVTALVWPTNKMGRRILVEGIYYTIKSILVCGLFIAFYLLFMLIPGAEKVIAGVFAYTLALLLTFLCNFPLAYFAWKIKNNRSKKKLQQGA